MRTCANGFSLKMTGEGLKFLILAVSSIFCRLVYLPRSKRCLADLVVLRSVIGDPCEARVCRCLGLQSYPIVFGVGSIVSSESLEFHCEVSNAHYSHHLLHLS